MSTRKYRRFTVRCKPDQEGQTRLWQRAAVTADTVLREILWMKKRRVWSPGLMKGCHGHHTLQQVNSELRRFSEDWIHIH